MCLTFGCTERGTAEMHGGSIPQRAGPLIGIADPRFREQLEIEARRAHLL